MATGVAPHADPPIEWSETKNIRWKVDLPGLGSASPIVWGEYVYIQTAIKTDRIAPPNGQGPSLSLVPKDRLDIARSVHDAPTHIYQFVVLAYNRKSGHLVWRRMVRRELPRESGHPEGSLASASPVTDGEHLFAYFGSHGLYCLDLSGQVVWSKDFGDMITRRGHGEGSSPALYRNTIVVNWDHEGDSFIVALDKATGRRLWRRARDEFTSWSTPLILENDGHPQVVVSATKRIRSYDLATGDLVWECGGMTVNVIPSPVAGLGLVFASSGYHGDVLLAIRYAHATGDLTGSSAVAWTFDRGMPYVPSPLLYEDTVYVIAKNRARLSCFDARSGRPYYSRTRLKGVRAVYASPVGAAGRVYIVGRDGGTVVIKRGPSCDVLATNRLDDGFDASPAIVGDAIYLRGRQHLYCIARRQNQRMRK